MLLTIIYLILIFLIGKFCTILDLFYHIVLIARMVLLRSFFST